MKTKILKQLNKVTKLLKNKSLRNVLLGAYVIFFTISFYHMLFAHKIIPGVKIGNVSVSGKTYDQAKKLLEDYEKKQTKELIFKYQEKTYKIAATDINLIYDHNAAVTRAFEVGRTKNVVTDTKDKIAGIFKTLYIKDFYDFDDAALQNSLLAIRGEVNDEPQDAHIILNKNKVELATSKDGSKIDSESLYNIVISAFDRMNFGDKPLPVAKAEAKIKETELSKLLPEVERILSNSFSVAFEKQTWNLTKDQMLDLIEFKKNPDAVMDFNDAKLESYLEMLEQEVNELPRGQVTSTDGDKVVNFEIIKDGREIDTKKFIDEFKSSVLSYKTTLEIPIRVVSGPASKEKYGIFSLLGEGKSKFEGSAQSRIHNLTLAAGRTNGVLVAPGVTYSMNKSIGEISDRTGFQSAFVISAGRTVLGAGGGVCQVSTTLFRAVLNAGLPIVMRYPHDYRVHYYEEESPVGFDASIFQPSLDFRFKNDTPNYILVQSSWNLDDLSLNFKLYGTPDSREVEISEPIVSNVSPPPAALYQDDPTLAKGVVRQIDFSAWGANVYFTRVVKRDGKTLYEDKFSSNYRPWQAIFLVGTKL